MKIAFLIYPLGGTPVCEDTTFWIAQELTRRGHTVRTFEHGDLFLQNSPFIFSATPHIRIRKSQIRFERHSKPVDLSTFDCIFIRKEPPVDEDYLRALQILDSLKEKLFILNDPAGILLSNEKIAALEFKDLAPPSLVTDKIGQARRFIKKLRSKCVIKSLDAKGGAGIFTTGPGDKNLPSLLESATQRETRKTLIQRYAPTERYGDKRIMLLEGAIIGAYLRRPAAHDFRANLHSGATLHRATLTRRDKKIVEILRPYLLARGLYFTGIDVIGNYLTEINVTSPAGISQINQTGRVNLENTVCDYLERKVSGR